MRIRKWKWQFGAAITLPTPWGATVYAKDLPMSDRLRKHESEHIRQLERMGAVKYLATHIWARIVTLDFYAKKHPIEAEAYAAERA